MTDHLITVHKHAGDVVAENAAALHSLNTRFNDLEQEISKQLQQTLVGLEILEVRTKTSFEGAMAGYTYLAEELATLANTMTNTIHGLTSVSYGENSTTLDANLSSATEP